MITRETERRTQGKLDDRHPTATANSQQPDPRKAQAFHKGPFTSVPLTQHTRWLLIKVTRQTKKTQLEETE